MRLICNNQLIRDIHEEDIKGIVTGVANWATCSKNMNIPSDTVHCDREISHISSPALKRAMSQSAFPPRTAFRKGKDYSVTRVGKSLLTQIKEDNFIPGDTLSNELSN